jgi:epidermal growth factor receptor substrate 15
MFGPSFATPTISTPPPTSFENDQASRSQQAAGTEITPSTSPFPSSPNELLRGIEPPAPPSSRQITSAALPFRAPLERAGSISSSVRVVLPASRLSPADTPRVGTPSASTSSVYSQNGESPVSAAKELPGSGKEKLSPSPPFGQGTPNLRANEASTMAEQSSNRSSAQDIPGAFPQSETPRIEVPPAIGAAATASQESEKSKETERAVDNLDTNFDQYFGGPAHSRSPSQKAADFDSAFANFKPAMTNGTGSSSKNEFPPIRELDDDATDDSSEVPTGFDDDFILASHPRSPKEKEAAHSKPEVASALPASLLARPAFNTVPSTNSSLPDIGAQASPPTYGESLPKDNPDQFPPEFQGLLPHRGDPTSPLLQPPHSVNHKTGEPASNRLAEAFAPEAAGKGTTTSKKVTEDDFDSAFANMTAAPVVDEDEDDDDVDTSFATNHNPEFDPTFDSPAPSKSTIATLPATTHFSSTMDPTPTNKDMGASNDVFGFSPTVNTSQPSAPAAQPTTTLKASDWDDMFAGIDNPSTSFPSPNTKHSPAAAATQTFPPSTSTPPPTATNSTPTPQTPPPTTTQPDASKPAARPIPGRALTIGTEHDDPILKRLTAMGWSREESLQALELFDYNLDKVCWFVSR